MQTNEKQREKARQVTKDWKKKNPEKVRIQNAAYRKKHKDIIRKHQLVYLHTPMALAYKKLWHSRTRALQTQAKGFFTKEQFLQRCEYYGWRCYLCGVELTIYTLNIEHRIPFFRNGTNWPANLAPSCPTCNNKKGRKTELEYRAMVKM